MNKIKNSDNTESISNFKEISSKKEFDEIIKNNPLIFVDFYADWCGPCRRIAPKYKVLAEKFPKYCFIKCDIDKVIDLPKQYDIRSMPTFVVIKDGVEVDRVIGSNESELSTMIKSAIENKERE